MNTISQTLGPIMLDIEGLTLTDTDEARLQHPSVGGIILFSRNYANKQQLKHLTKQIKLLRSPQLLIAVDQEGGRVQRFKRDFTIIPPMAFFSQSVEDQTFTKEQALCLLRQGAHLLAQELIECGVDFSFAPVLDLGKHQDTVIGDRAFHVDPLQVTSFASAFVSGFNNAGMQATGKHFPGHGQVTADSHHETPIDTRSYEQILRSDLHPFIALKDQLGAIMTAHISFPSVTKELPTYSSHWLQTILRQKIGFKGLIFSDDLSMGGAHTCGDIIQRTRRALSAGCDMILVCNKPASVEVLLQANTWQASNASQQRFSNMYANTGIQLTNSQTQKTQNKLKTLQNSLA